MEMGTINLLPGTYNSSDDKNIQVSPGMLPGLVIRATGGLESVIVDGLDDGYFIFQISGSLVLEDLHMRHFFDPVSAIAQVLCAALSRLLLSNIAMTARLHRLSSRLAIAYLQRVQARNMVLWLCLAHIRQPSRTVYFNLVPPALLEVL